MTRPGRPVDSAVIIPTRDRPEALERCLAALAVQTLPADRFEVIVVDDGGHAAIEPVVEAFKIRLDVRRVRCTHRGPAGARNVGADAARAPLLAFTDDDCRPAPDWLERLVARFHAEPAVLWGGRVVNGLERNAFASASQLILDLAYAHHNPDPGQATFFASNNMAVPTAGFRRMAGFDASFRIASEDRDFCARWREAGMPIAFAPEAIVRHEHHLSFVRFCRQHFRYGRGAWRHHRELRRRGHGRLTRDLSFHGLFIGRALEPVLARRPLEALKLVALLTVWQIANAAGFACEAGRGVLPRARLEGPLASLFRGRR